MQTFMLKLSSNYPNCKTELLIPKHGSGNRVLFQSTGQVCHATGKKQLAKSSTANQIVEFNDNRYQRLLMKLISFHMKTSSRYFRALPMFNRVKQSPSAVTKLETCPGNFNLYGSQYTQTVYTRHGFL